MGKPTKDQVNLALDAREEGLPLTADQKQLLLEHDKMEAQPPKGRPSVRLTQEDKERRDLLSFIDSISPGKKQPRPVGRPVGGFLFEDE